MRPIRYVIALIALASLPACSTDPTTPVKASESPALTGGYMSSGNAFDPGPNNAGDTVTARSPGYLGSGY